MKRINSYIAILTISASLGLIDNTAVASTLTLEDGGNSIVTINPDSQAGVNSWLVNDVNQLAQQWFWYRIGETGGQYSIDTISAPSVQQFDPTTATITYSNSAVKVGITYTLTGDSFGYGDSDLSESIKVTNVSGGTLDLHFYEYSNFTLNDGVGGDTVSFPNPQTVDQWNTNSSTLSETVHTPPAYASEANYYPNTLNSLNSGVPYDLNPADVSAGPGDVTWAYEWVDNLRNNQSLLVSKDKQLSVVAGSVPEPTSLALLFGACSRDDRVRLSWSQVLNPAIIWRSRDA